MYYEAIFCDQDFSSYNHPNEYFRSNRRERPCCIGDI
jgi:hypothetical protein